MPQYSPGDYAAFRRDQNRTRWKVTPVFALAFAAAYLVSKHFKPRDGKQ